MICRLDRCIMEVRWWMRANMVQLNEDKTELVLVSPKSFSRSARPCTFGATVGDYPTSGECT